MEPQEPLQACSGKPLPLPLYIYTHTYIHTYTYFELHGVTSRNSVIFILIAAKTSNSKYFRILYCDVSQVFVTSPYDFPVAGTDVISGSTAYISLSAQVTYTTPQVLDLNIKRRGCLYENESRSLGFPSYRHANCIAQCHRDSTLLYCNCTPYFYPTEGVNLSSSFIIA